MKNVTSGFVSFVSSGPGDPDLLTVRAVERLKTADAVLYDDLSSGPILALARVGADLVSVGKRAGLASPKQDHVSRLLVDYALTGARVVRLKSGDAGIFGRLEEEIDALKLAGVTFEIVPGVPVACAAAAAAGIPLTRRLHARRVQFITGADVTGQLPDNLNFAALSDPDAITAVYMGKRTFPALARALVAHGLAADTPALLAETVSNPNEVLRFMTIMELAKFLEEHQSIEPAVILYGALSQGDVANAHGLRAVE